MSRRRKQKAVEQAIKDSGRSPKEQPGGGGDLAERRAAARGTVKMHPAVLERVLEKAGAQAKALEAARAAGLVAARKTADIVPSRRSQNVRHARVDFSPAGADRLGIVAEVSHLSTDDLDTEALAAVVAAALTLYEMCRDADADIILTDVRLQEKSKA